MKPQQTKKGIRYYETPLGDFPSVTSIIRATESKKEKDKLRKWQQKMDKVYGTGSSDKQKDERAKEGTRTHELIELFMKGELLDPPADNYFPLALPLLKLLRRSWEGSEIQVYHPSGYAGTLDMIAEYEGKKTIIDFTTSKRIKQKKWVNNKFLQCAAYAIAHDYLYDSKPTQLCVVALSDRMQIFTEPITNWEMEWYRRVEQFYGLTDCEREVPNSGG